jgi:imidazolonepropionase-like amidohydrolase
LQCCTSLHCLFTRENVVRFVRLAGLVLTLAAAGVGIVSSGRADPRDGTLAITDAMIFDATGRAPFRGTVVVREGRIAQVGAQVKVPAGAKVISANGAALLPGFFDVHTHWSPGGTPATIPQIANAYVASGVTTVNDFHQQPESFAPRRAWMEALVAPHVNFVARMSTPGGHGADWGDTNTTKWVATPDAATREVAALQQYRPDFIKVFADGWRYGAGPDNTSMNLATLTAIVTEAHRHKERVLTHTVTVERGKDAARAGVDVIAHSLQDHEIDPEAVRLIKTAGTFYAPTLAIYEPAPAGSRGADGTAGASEASIRKFGYAKSNVKALHVAGVPVVLGTDSGIGRAAHGVSSLHEMELLVDAGLTPADALIAGTATSARALGLDSDRGTIAPGKRADLVLIEGAPWIDIRQVRKIRQVLIDGTVAFGAGAKLQPANQRTQLAAQPAEPLIDDFERADGRSSLDTLRLTEFDNGMDRSVVVPALVPRQGGGHALLVATHMAQKDAPQAGVLIPLSRGSVRPADLRRYKGVRLDLRGEGAHVVKLVTLAGTRAKSVEVGPEWTTTNVPFADLAPERRSRASEREIAPPAWQRDDVLQVGVSVKRPAQSTGWFEIDNVRFY